MGEAWREELTQGQSKFQISGGEEGVQGRSRLSLIMADGAAEVPATRRDFLVSGLGGALFGGLVAMAVMMNR
jgi:hypothetical protein